MKLLFCTDITENRKNRVREDASFLVTAAAPEYADALAGARAQLGAALQRIRTVDRRIAVQFWNKDETFRAPRFKPYKIRQDNYGLYRYRPYHMLEFTCAGEDWALCFPCYELPFFETLTGLHAE